MKNKLPFYLFVLGLLLVLISPAILSDGMFMDGLIYSAIANNLSNGIGTFWDLHFTKTLMPDFNGHPPLAIGLQSVFYTIFGGSRYIDKIYSLFTFVIVGLVIIRIWKHLGFENAWLPLLIWLLIPLVPWAMSNNMLENTMSVFTSLSVLFYLKSQSKQKCLFIVFAGIMLALGFLTKGFVAFFPWTLPFLLWLLRRKMSFRSMVLDTVGIFVFTIVPLILLAILWPEAKINLQKYIDIQVIDSLKNIVSVNSRFFIVKRLFAELLPGFGLCLIFIIWGWCKKFPMNLLKTNYKTALVFFLLGLTGVVPIMISMKQRGFYILATFPFFAIAIAVLLIPLVEFLFDDKFYKTKGFLFFKWISLGIFICGAVMSFYFANHIGRDKNKIKDMYAIIEVIPSGTTINILPSMGEDWSLYGYYARYKNISLDPNLDTKREYLLIQNNVFSDASIIADYEKIKIKTIDYRLYKKFVYLEN